MACCFVDLLQVILWEHVPAFIQSQVVDHLSTAIPAVQSEAVLRNVLVGSPAASRLKRAATANASISYGEDADLEFELPDTPFEPEQHSSITVPTTAAGASIGAQQTDEAMDIVVSVVFVCSVLKFPICYQINPCD